MIDIKTVKSDLQQAILMTSTIGLLHTTKWLSELCYSIEVEVNNPVSNLTFYESEYDIFAMAKCYFDCKEYERCAYFTKNCKTPCIRFLHYFSSYLAIELKSIMRSTEINYTSDVDLSKNLLDLHNELKGDYESDKLDGYMLYLYGVFLKKLNLNNLALQPFLESIHKEPLLWASWFELADLINDPSTLRTLHLPDHWMTKFFLGYTYLELQLNEKALDMYNQLKNLGFEKSNYVHAQIAISYHNKRDVLTAISTFNNLRIIDPYRLDNLDTLSNLLFVKDRKVELADLAQHSYNVDKYRVETCCVLGNYYSLRSEHQKSVISFQKALKLDTQYLAAWTLMGHEFMELKNYHAAIHSYRKAIDVNCRDYRAWYGLGQTYEIIKMPYYCLYYYKQAQMLRPKDSRMLVALGETYEKLDKIKEAFKCFSTARSVGDIDGLALLRMAKLYEQLEYDEEAKLAYVEYTKESEISPAPIDLCLAYRFLAHYHLKMCNLELAREFTHMCLRYEETKEEAKTLIKSIEQRKRQYLGGVYEDTSIQGADSYGPPPALLKQLAAYGIAF
uniref:Cdc23 domain-containing protein n=2 Tax=Clastoptera arizonana TaxID=38151 RepID=A0A1B6E2C3_9HEMI